MVKINLDMLIFELDGSTVKDSSGNPLFLRAVFINAILANFKDEVIDGVEKLKRFGLAQGFQSDDNIEITKDFVEEILKKINKIYGTLVYSRVYEILNNA